MCSEHTGITCNYCQKTDFSGPRFKCLICIDYDLCMKCYEDCVRSAEHLSSHPMQCLLTSSEMDLFFDGDNERNIETSQSFTCPYCGELGFSSAALLEHTATRHVAANASVLCPICVSNSLQQNGDDSDANETTEDLALHLVLEHRSSRTQLHELTTTTTMPLSKTLPKQRPLHRTPIELSPSLSSSESLSPVHEVPIIRLMSQTLSDMRIYTGRSRSVGDSSPQENPDALSSEPLTVGNDLKRTSNHSRHSDQRRLSFHFKRPDDFSSWGSNRVHNFSDSLRPSTKSLFRLQDPLMTPKTGKIKSDKKLTIIDDDSNNDEEFNTFLLPDLCSSSILNLQIEEANTKSYRDRCDRAEFVKALFLSMLSRNYLQDINPLVKLQNSANRKEIKNGEVKEKFKANQNKKFGIIIKKKFVTSVESTEL